MVHRIEVNGEILEFPDEMTDAQMSAAIQGMNKPKVSAGQALRERSDARRMPTAEPKVEFPDQPTIGRMELPGVALFNGKDITGKPGISWAQKAATLFGPMLTDNPTARQEILLKNLPGATGTEDAKGNPEVTYGDKKYYTARPGEFDAMDAGRATAGVAATLPMVAAAPAGIPAMMAIGGATGVAQSVLEDVGAQAAGADSQEIDPVKAGISGGVSAVLPPVVQKLVTPIARSVYRAGAQPLVDRAGRVTTPTGPAIGGRPSGQEVFNRARIDPAMFTPQQLRLLEETHHNNFGNVGMVQQRARQLLGEEFDTSLTTGQQTGARGQLAREDQMRHGGRGGRAEDIMQTGRQEQVDQLHTAGDRLRSELTGAPTAMDEANIGNAVRSGVVDADNAARANVREQYTRAFDNPTLIGNGIPHRVRLDQINNLPQRVEESFYAANRPGGALYRTNESTPNAVQATNYVRRFAETGSVYPSAVNPPGTTAISWQHVDAARKQLQGMYRSSAPRSADREAVAQIIGVFDQHLGEINPLLEVARQHHAARVQAFRPQPGNSASLNSALETINTPGASGQEIFNKIFAGNAMNKGEAGPIIDRLEVVLANNPEAMSAVREAALQRLMVGKKTGDNVNPVPLATALRNAINGPQGDIYRRLFPPDQIARLQRYGELSGHIGQTTSRRNASGTSYAANLESRKNVGMALGGVLGGAAGAATGIPALGVAGTMAGGAAGRAGDNLVSGLLARRAILGQGVPGAAGMPNALPGLYSLPPILQGLLQEREQE